MTFWFHAPEFRYNATPSGCFIVRAYIATFQNTNNREPFQLCMLHDDWHGAFPLRFEVLEFLASEFGTRNGLDLVGTSSYGYIQRGVNWKRYQCCYSNWIGWFCPICETQNWHSNWRWLHVYVMEMQSLLPNWQSIGGACFTVGLWG